MAARGSATSSLPSFKSPPVNEVVCGFRYQPLQALRIPHYGLLWDKFRENYPVLQHATPLATDDGIVVDASTGAPIPRIWFVSKDESQLLQLQADRFYFNWRERGKDYPRYTAIIEEFESATRIFSQFLEEFKLGPLNPVEYELTYFNQIPKGSAWVSNDDIATVFRDFNWQPRQGRFLPNPTNSAWQVRFALPDGMGWLSAKLSQGKRLKDETPVLVLEMAAKGMNVSDKSPQAVRKWYDLAREWIVRGFADLTTEKVQKSIWKRDDDDAA